MKGRFVAIVNVFADVPMTTLVLADRSVLRTAAAKGAVKTASVKMVCAVSRTRVCEVVAMIPTVSLGSAVSRMNVGSPAPRTPAAGMAVFVKQDSAKMGVEMTPAVVTTLDVRTINA